MIADVVGAVHNPKPELMTSSGQNSPRYDDSTPSVRMHRKPIETSAMLTKITVRSPSLGRYRGDNAEKVSKGSASGLNATAVRSGEYPMICWTYSVVR